MRGVYTPVNDIRKMVFAEVAKLSYDYKDGDLSQMEQIPYRIIPSEVSTYRESVFLERAIVRERLRLAMGLPLRAASQHAPVSEGALECVRPENTTAICWRVWPVRAAAWREPEPCSRSQRQLLL